MVRTIDGARRRLDLVDAVWRIIVRDGLEAASVRNVAAEADLSAGSVRHFFTTQAELQVFAMQAMADRVRGRVARAAQEPDERRRIVGMLAELLPLSDESAAEFRVWLQFVLRAGFDHRLAPIARTTFDEVRALIVTVLDGARELGLTRPDLDVASAAAELNALIDGLTFDVITAPHLLSRDAARNVFERALGRVLDPEGAA